MKDSIDTFKEDIKSLNLNISELENSQPYYKHIVLPGDNLWKISYRYYNTGTRYKEIAEWNNLNTEATISIGDTLLIK